MNEIEQIKELETQLVMLRLKTRHIDFTQDYDRSKYTSHRHKSSEEIQNHVIGFLKKQTAPVKTEDVIKVLVKTIEGLGEFDFEKTTSGNIRIYSGIRTAIEYLTKTKVVAKPERAKIILSEKLHA